VTVKATAAGHDFIVRGRIAVLARNDSVEAGFYFEPCVDRDNACLVSECSAQLTQGGAKCPRVVRSRGTERGDRTSEAGGAGPFSAGRHDEAGHARRPRQRRLLRCELESVIDG